MTQELMTAMGDIETACMTLEQVHAKISLEVFQSLGNRRLGYGKRLRRTDNRSAFGNRHEIPQLFKCERHAPLPLNISNIGRTPNQYRQHKRKVRQPASCSNRLSALFGAWLSARLKI